MHKDNKSPYYTKSFSISKENEKDIYDYLIEVEKTKKITEYIKELIRKDMSGGFSISNEVSETYIKNLVNKLVEEKINSLNISKTNNETVVELSDVTDLSNDDNKDKNSFNNNDELENNYSDEKKDINNKSEDVKTLDKTIKKKKGVPIVAGVMS